MPTLRLISILVLLSLPGCSAVAGKFMGGMYGKKIAKAASRMGQAKVVGVIDMVNPEQNYVLINCEQRLNLPVGTEIIAQNADGTKTKLKISPEHKGNYITADIQEGTPQVRDLVLYQVKPTDKLPTPSATGTTPLVESSSPVVQLTPVMQGDVIPPLDAPYQPLAPTRPMLAPQPMVQPQPQYQQPAPARRPAPPPVTEPAPDNSDLPPVVR